jgi:hypothetical protein
MLKKIRTARSVFLTYGVSELLRLAYRKAFRAKIPSEFATEIRFESSDRFMATISEAPIHKIKNTHLLDDERLGFFGSIYDLGPELSQSLLGATKDKKPSLVIETGVAAGKSTNLILNQLRINGSGRLVSIDVTSNVGELIEQQNKFLWTLEVLPNFLRRQRFEALLNKYSKAEIFLHDSDHSVAWQLFEIKRATVLLSDLSYILVDDIQPEVANYLRSKFGEVNCFFFNELGMKKSLIVRTFTQF